MRPGGRLLDQSNQVLPSFPRFNDTRCKLRSDLAGHFSCYRSFKKGTGALQRREGRFELAHSDTIFLDEIGELPHETQNRIAACASGAQI